MSLYTLCPSQILPVLLQPRGLRIEESNNTDLLAWMASSTGEEMTRRMANDNKAFVAYIDEMPAAFGWVASGKALIGELHHEIILPVGNRYLWNFNTMENFRGLGIYPALLQYIIGSEREKANRFWIIHAPENKSSLKGIQKAGFQYVGTLYTRNNKTAIETTSLSKTSRALLTEMDIAISEEQPASCWNCSSPYLKKRTKECCCAASGSECVDNRLLSMA